MDRYEALRHYFGHTSFREGQDVIIDALMNGLDAMAIMPTGAGKSMCFQIPALISDGVTLVVSPLISLMKDQVLSLVQMGAPAAYLNSSLTLSQQREALRRAAEGQYKIIYVAPERLNTPDFLQFALSADISLIAVDEAHCVSQWGQDFRPSYLRIAEFIARLKKRPPIGAFTATATPRVKEDILSLLQLQNPKTVVTGFDRPKLHFSVRKIPTLRERDEELLHIIRDHSSDSGIIYCATRKNVEDVCQLLSDYNISATRYHAGLSDDERRSNQDDFRFDRAQIMVATNAFGMGIDKSNVRYVVHYNMPKDLESYYQEAGRAGRDGEEAECILLYNGRDVHTARWLIEHSETRLDLSEDERASLIERDLERLKQMTFYTAGRKCLRKFILNYFGEHAPEHCMNCSVCAQEAPVYTPAPPKEKREPGLLGALKDLRNRIARIKGVPAYVIFSDETLHDMADKLPTTMEEFSMIKGVGDIKLELYGPDFLSILRVYALAKLHGQRIPDKK